MDNYASLPVGEFFTKMITRQIVFINNRYILEEGERLYCLIDESYLINGRKSDPLYDTDG
jgi:hypothetical protein